MILHRALIALTLLSAPFAAQAQAQTWQPRPGDPVIDPHRYQVDQHRLEMDRLRIQADQREAAARQMELEARLTRQRLEAARQAEPVQPPAWRALRSPEEERALRRAAEERRRATVDGTSQIDRWLDRPRD